MMVPTLLSLLLLAPTEEPAKPNDKDKARIAALQMKSKAAEEELRTLQQKPNASDAERLRLRKHTRSRRYRGR